MRLTFISLDNYLIYKKYNEILLLLLISIFGFLYFYDYQLWAGNVNIGSTQYGDAAFWWNGAIQFSEGIIKENVNLTFRMGYAIFSGFFISVIGPNFFIFHKVLLLIFLYSLTVFYFAIKPQFGKVASFLVIILFINPYIAERLAISTSDPVGLIFSIFSLSFFCFGVQKKLDSTLLFFVGFFLSLASMTRPLMSLFILIAVVYIAILRNFRARKRIVASSFLVSGFILPIITWLAVMYSVTGVFQLAGHDSSAIYAASDPDIQVWNGEMYTKVENSAKKHFSTSQITPAQLSKEFWNLSLQNYINNPQYHAYRFFNNISQVARFDAAKSTGYFNEVIVKRFLIGFFIIYLFIKSIREKYYYSGIILLCIFFTYLAIPEFVSYTLVLIGVLLFPLLVLQKNNSQYLAVGIIVLYWWVGLVALFMVGGIWGPPLGKTYEINALGYRLGSQFFFANDVILVATLLLIPKFRFTRLNNLFKKTFSKVNNQVNSMYQENDTVYEPSQMVVHINRLILVIIFGLFLVGICIVSLRYYERANLKGEEFPKITIAADYFSKSLGLLGENYIIASNINSVITEIGSADIGIKNSKYVVLNGGMSDFIWNLPGQSRSKAILYAQEFVRPFSMSPNEVYVEFPEHLKEKDWTRKQGAWLIKSYGHAFISANLPFYYSIAAVKGFIPLTKDEQSYDLMAAKIFNTNLYASQLDKLGDLKIENADIRWLANSGPYKYPRRFEFITQPDQLLASITINLKNSIHPKQISFCIEGDEKNKDNSTLIEVVGKGLKKPKEKFTKLLYSGGTQKNCTSENYQLIDISEFKFNEIKLIINSEKKSEFQIYELSISSKDYSSM